MSRIRVDSRPSIIVRPHLARVATLAEVEDVANAVADLVRVSVLPQLWQVPGLHSDQCAIEITMEDDFRCRHCNSFWTGKSRDFNCGCCGQDAANDPERLAAVRETAHDLHGVAFYSKGENGQRSEVPISWPNTLSTMAINWLDAGRPDAWASLLLFGIKRVRDGEWRSLRKPLSPSVMAFTGLLDGVRDRRPDDLACALLELMDDMGLLTANAGASDAL
ncbi:hypothetical protein [Phenylobacterium sp.]|uniref:hypothetical protein n=1 Tax=Phenylobacterium sp. TaxID=1871053 RepID=UPI0035615272